MYFSDLLKLKKDEYGRMNYDELKELLPNVPNEVLKQFIFDHGRNESFQEQYSHLNLKKLKWKEIKLKAEDIVQCTIYEEFIEYVDEVSNRLDYFNTESYNCIDIREEVVNSWQKNLTWLREPIFIDGKLLKFSNNIHLVEGHTRLGILKGFLLRNLIQKESLHRIWFGSYKS